MVLGLTPGIVRKLGAQAPAAEKPATNIAEALKVPRVSHSLPGRYPGKVVKVTHANPWQQGQPDEKIIHSMLSRSLLMLTGALTLQQAWRQFVSPQDVIGLKVNPVAGKMLSTNPVVVKAIISQLESAGIPRKNIVIWDRREFQLHEAGFTAEQFPGITVTGTEQKDEAGSFYDEQGRLYGEMMIDRDWFYHAETEMEYDKETLPYMINQGKYSYFSKIATQQVDKIINVPILKNAGSSVTLCLKNLAFGAISNTARLHQQLWAETCAQVPCFPPLRDKVVLNIVDGIKGCYDGGPGANPQFFTNYNLLMAGTDPVAVDRIGYEIVLQKRLQENVQSEASPRAVRYMEMAADYGLGIADPGGIQLKELKLS